MCFSFSDSLYSVPNGHIFVDSPSIPGRKSKWKVRENYIDFERRIHVEIMTSIRRRNFDVDSTFKIGEISMNSSRGFFYIVSMSNQRCRIRMSNFLLWEPVLSYFGMVLSRCNFNNIDVITDSGTIGTIGTIPFGNFATTQINRNNDNFYFLLNNTNKDYNTNIYK